MARLLDAREVNKQYVFSYTLAKDGEPERTVYQAVAIGDTPRWVGGLAGWGGVGSAGQGQASKSVWPREPQGWAGRCGSGQGGAAWSRPEQTGTRLCLNRAV